MALDDDDREMLERGRKLAHRLRRASDRIKQQVTHAGSADGVAAGVLLAAAELLEAVCDVAREEGRS